MQLRQSTLTRRKRKRQMAVALSTQKENQSDDPLDQWAFNHTALARYHYRLDYCERCDRRFTCDAHNAPIELLPVEGDWEPLLNYLPVHLVRFKGLSWVESILFLEKSVSPQLLAQSRHMHNRKALHPMNMFRALWRLMQRQRVSLHNAFATAGTPITPPMICDFTFATEQEAQTEFIDQLKIAKHSVCDALLSELATAAGTSIDTGAHEWRTQVSVDRQRMVFLLRKRRLTVCIGSNMWRLHAPPGRLMQLLASTDTVPHSPPCAAPTQ